MTERPRADQVALERLFPDAEKRQLAGDFIEEASRLAGISRIITYDLSGQQRIMVIAYGDTSPDDINDPIRDIYGKFSNHRDFNEVLGFPNIVTELQYNDLVLCDPETIKGEITVLWERPKVQVPA
ncbi:hypothetical protein A2696_01350 [Candidatus Curtissbacteria bacterium RIFCSPHIGHO2_01_FULL_41_13]|uniref:Uncharacterized protein n=1 Tax=Candidatus Curtissbacteria bacterium RIFCSPHIGHO2_01_FULL_41_13 TaxID=1797745 RepID=A0A1F5FY15_9BACT|nr:MAG: hypothetical protein A2696_01350 [Candidatus Curtissbacteria bacterium RIFCSPHIGHO2_01_FULL_41_13]